MTLNLQKIKTVIVDDEQHAIDNLRYALEPFSDVKVVATANTFKSAKEKLLETAPDLVFLDVEMPGKTGFDLLAEVRDVIEKPFTTIFHTAYEKYTIRALRESAFDFILKPVNTDELANVMERYRKKVEAKTNLTPTIPITSLAGDIVTLPTPTGIQFFKRNEIALLKRDKHEGLSRVFWIVVLFNEKEIRLRSKITAEHLIDLLGVESFLQINQSAIVNLNYTSSIELKNRECRLLPPFENYHLCISRSCMGEVRTRFDMF